MEESKRDITFTDGRVTICHDSREIARGFSFPTFPLLNQIVASDFRHKRKAQTYIRAHRCAFVHDFIDYEVMWRLKSQSCAYIYGHSFYVLAVKLRWTKVVDNDSGH